MDRSRHGHELMRSLTVSPSISNCLTAAAMSAWQKDVRDALQVLARARIMRVVEPFQGT
jgi:hypothetical protein